MAKKRRTRRRSYTKAQRARIIATADREGLSAKQVQQKFGVIPVTYYAWRKRAKLSVGESSTGMGGGRSTRNLRQTVRSKLAKQLPRIVNEELDRLLESMLGRT